MRNSCRLLAGLVGLALALPIGAASPGQLIILEAVPNPQTGLLTIIGVNLGSSAAVVKVAGQTLAIQSATETQIVATMPSLANGTYLLSVTRGNAMVDQDTFSLTVGSIGTGGDIESINVGPGLVGGGSSGDVTVDVDLDYLDSFYIRTDAANNGPFARLDVPNFFHAAQTINGFVQMNLGFNAPGPSFVEFSQPDAGAMAIGNFATTGSNRGLTVQTASESSIAVVGTAHAPTGGTGAALTTDGDGGSGVYAAANHPTGGGNALMAEVFSPNAVAGFFRNNGDGLILQGIGSVWPPVFTVDSEGNVTAYDFISTSSRRYRTNVAEIEGALEAIESLHPVSFDWKATGKRDIGLIAEEVAAVVPDAVAVDAQGAKGIDYQSLTALLIEAMQEQQQQIRELQRRLEQRAE